ncbi:MAG: DUF4330 family protein [Clostridia bacterium]|nr:DUF4330 family protein [Clostridia bacterium]
MSEKNIKIKKERKFKPNIIDFLIVVIVIGVVAGIVMRMGVIEKITVGNRLEEARISFIVKDISGESESYFKNGDSFNSKTHNCHIGTLETINSRRAVKYIENENGRMVKTESADNRVDMLCTLIGEGTFTSEGFFLGGSTYIAPGSEINFNSQNIVGILTITDIQPVDGTK